MGSGVFQIYENIKKEFAKVMIVRWELNQLILIVKEAM